MKGDIGMAQKEETSGHFTARQTKLHDSIPISLSDRINLHMSELSRGELRARMKSFSL